MAILAMALMQQHDARRDILTEPAARLCTAIEARGHSELGAFRTWGIPNWGHSELEAQSGRKNQPACFLFVRLRISQRRKNLGALNSARMFDYYPDRSSPILVNFGWRGVTGAALLPGRVIELVTVTWWAFGIGDGGVA